MPKLLFHPDIAHEVKASYDWYQEQAQGLGDDFLNELEAAYETIETMPHTWPKFQQHFRRFLLNKFPFSIIYHLTPNTIYVVAIMHHSRKPYYWKNRF